MTHMLVVVFVVFGWFMTPPPGNLPYPAFHRPGDVSLTTLAEQSEVADDTARHATTPLVHRNLETTMICTKFLPSRLAEDFPDLTAYLSVHSKGRAERLGIR